MALFPISDGVVQLSTDTPADTDPFRNGLRLKSDNTAAYSATSGGLQSQNGFLLDVNGAVVCVDATSSIPVGSQYRNGLLFSPEGGLCVSGNDAVAWINGIPLDTNGSVVMAGLTPASPPPTWNPSDKSISWILSNSDKTATNSTQIESQARSVQSVGLTEKKYWEISADVIGNVGEGYAGIKTSSSPLGSFSETYLWVPNGTYYSTGGTATGTPGAFSQGDVLMFAFDGTAKRLYVGVNGVWRNSGNPSAGTGYVFTSSVSGAQKAIIWRSNNTSSMFVFQLKNPLMYPIPSGYSAL